MLDESENLLDPDVLATDIVEEKSDSGVVR
jgi:hypothetical protein